MRKGRENVDKEGGGGAAKKNNKKKMKWTRKRKIGLRRGRNE